MAVACSFSVVSCAERRSIGNSLSFSKTSTARYTICTTRDYDAIKGTIYTTFSKGSILGENSERRDIRIDFLFREYCSGCRRSALNLIRKRSPFHYLEGKSSQLTIV